MIKTILLVALAMLAFAANSLLCRMALSTTNINPATFTTVRIISGAFALILLSAWITHKNKLIANTIKATSDVGLTTRLKANASIVGGVSLFIYAVCFSFAYVSMSTGAGALLLFGSVQLTMIGSGFIKGERFNWAQWMGFILAFSGLITLLLPSATAPTFMSSMLMATAGIAWGVYSIIGKRSSSALLATTGNFTLASLLCGVIIVHSLFFSYTTAPVSQSGVLYAIASGVLASAFGYAMWYTALPLIKSTSAATVQLSVPVLATLMGWAFLEEQATLQIILASIMTLSGIFFVLRR